MVKSGDKQAQSTLLLDEYYSSQDGRFLSQLRGLYSQKKIEALVERIKKDQRPWVREQLLAYLDLPMDCYWHEPFVKRLFKHFEGVKDDRMTGAFAASFDRLVRRIRKTRYRYDYQSRQYLLTEHLRLPLNTLPNEKRSYQRHAPDSWMREYYQSNDYRLFSHTTRCYLRRRAWRYFRHVGFSHPERYVEAVQHALMRYRDEDLSAGEHMLECWTLMHICFHHSDVLNFHTHRVKLAAGKKIADLTAAPAFPKLWQEANAFEPLIKLTAAPSRLVRIWCLYLLKAHHEARFTEISVEQLINLFQSSDPDIQTFASELLAKLSTASWPLATWMKLLEVQSPGVLEVICQRMAKDVMPDRLTKAQCAELACVQATPIARMGFEFLKQKSIDRTSDQPLLLSLADSQCDAINGEMTTWALSFFTPYSYAIRDSVLHYFDSLQKPIREAAWAWMTTEASREKSGLSSIELSMDPMSDPALWACLIETPFDELRLKMVDLLERRNKLPDVKQEDLGHIWRSVLLGVHRGGRQKSRAVRQITRTLKEQPEQAEQLLPVLAVALRSIRGPERRAGLSAVATLMRTAPVLASQIQQVMPEFQLVPLEAAGISETPGTSETSGASGASGAGGGQ